MALGMDISSKKEITKKESFTRGFDLIKSMMYTKPDHITILEKIQELDEIYEKIKI